MRYPLIFACLFLASGLAAAEEEATRIVPETERDIARDLGMEGPGETTGIAEATVLAAVGLGDDFEGMDGRVLRARVITMLPGGTVAVHQHDRRTGIAYVLEGEVVEHRNDASEPLIRRAGEAAVEKTGTIHWWKNESDDPVRVLVVDIVPEAT